MSNPIAAIASRLAAWRRREIARAELESMDDRTLADIGLRRSDIPLVLTGRFQPAGVARVEKPVVPANLNTRRPAAA